jgi:hypothetical protein
MQNSAITPKYLAKILQQFLADAPQAVAIEDGELLFEFATAKYSVSGEGKCILHLWSEERNAVRRVLDAELKGGTLRLSVVRFGQASPRRWRSAPTLTGARAPPSMLLALSINACWNGSCCASIPG